MTDAETLRRIQAEQRPWVAHNFGDRPPWMPLLGIVEEAGELSEADHQRDLNDISDALADIMIFALDYCSGMGWDVGEIWLTEVVPPQAGPIGILISIGKLCHAHLKAAQGIRVSEDHVATGRQALAGLFANLRAKDGNLVERVVQTWQEVRKRDWKADPVKAVGPEPEKPELAEPEQPVLIPFSTLVTIPDVEPAPTPEPVPEPGDESIEDFLGTLDLR